MLNKHDVNKVKEELVNVIDGKLYAIYVAQEGMLFILDLEESDSFYDVSHVVSDVLFHVADIDFMYNVLEKNDWYQDIVTYFSMEKIYQK